MSLLNADRSRPVEGGASYSLVHRLFRVLWSAIWLVLASWTPPPLHRWRVLLLRMAGANIDKSAHVYGSARIWYPPNLTMGKNSCLGPRVDCYCMAPIKIDERVVISQGAVLCAGTHDIQDKNFQLVVKPIRIKDEVWVAAEAFVGPGVTLEEGTVIGARAVVFKDTEPGWVYAGNPAVKLKVRYSSKA